MLSTKQKKFLRSQGHKLKPVVIVGDAGVSESLLNELETTLEHHELIKIRVNAMDHSDRDDKLDQILTTSGAELVQRIGHVAVIYRPAKKPVLKLP